MSTTILGHIVTLSATAALALGLSACGHNATSGPPAPSAPAPGALDAAEPLVALRPQALRPSARAAVPDRLTLCRTTAVLPCCLLVCR